MRRIPQIPRKIHYCWFGKKPLPKSAVKCIKSWKKYFPEYEIIEWNEDNYDVNKIPYIKQAYQAGKYAFVSDYARFDILFNEGGIYFDTDVEVIKSFDDVLANGPFMGCEIDGCESEQNETHTILINPGIGFGALPHMSIYGEILEYYKSQNFILADGSFNLETIVRRVTKILLSHGLKNIKGIQDIAEIKIYPKDYFNPLDSNTGKLCKTSNTHSIHWYSMSWLSPVEKWRSKLTRPIHRIFGVDFFKNIRMKK